MNNSIQPMNTLDKFGYRELAELNALIQAYANASTRPVDKEQSRRYFIVRFNDTNFLN